MRCPKCQTDDSKSYFKQTETKRVRSHYSCNACGNIWQAGIHVSRQSNRCECGLTKEMCAKLGGHTSIIDLDTPREMYAREW